MSKKIISLALALIIALGILTAPAFAAATLSTDKASYAYGETITISYSGVTIDNSKGRQRITIAKEGSYLGDYVAAVGTGTLISQASGTVQFEIKMPDGAYEARLYQGESRFDANYAQNASVMFTVGGAATTPTPTTTPEPTPEPTPQPTPDPAQPAPGWTSSGWAKPEIEKAQSNGIIPDTLLKADLTKIITRAEFAAVSVKLYENLSGKKAVTASTNPFTDTSDTEVLRAYNTGLTAGTSATTFSPNVLLNREQAAVMLVRVLKASYIPGWTLATDSNFTLNFTQPAKFADDAKISEWAKPSVYFAAANNIIAGTGNNNFSPRATTAAEEAVNYASATREQAIVIAARMVDNLKGKPVDYSQGGGTTPTPDQKPEPKPEPTPEPTPQPPSGSIDQNLVSHWTRTIGTDFYHFYFREDGSFSWGKVSIAEYSYKGNYSVSNGKIYFTNVVFTNADKIFNEPDSYVDYVIEPDSQYGDQLKLDNTGNSFTGSTWWRRAKS